MSLKPISIAIVNRWLKPKPINVDFLTKTVLNRIKRLIRTLEKNSYRLPAYHRADISVTYTNKKTEKFESSFNFSVFNVYAQQNPFYVYYQTSGDIS